MAALNGHVECVQLLLDLGVCVSDVTIEDGTTIDLIGILQLFFSIAFFLPQ
jgi:E3 ubiquitin-protein ligase XBAT32/33